MDRPISKLLPSLEELENAPTDSLRTLCVQILDFEPPPKSSPGFLRGNLAWAIQALIQGYDPTTLRKRQLKTTSNPPSARKLRFMPGSQLVREWQGETYEVTILEKGYLWQDRPYRSLSRIAQEITGTRWSGPRFFGLVKTSS